MKQPFRYARGEFLNSVYLRALVDCPNLAVKDIVDELVYQICAQWKLDEELSAEEMAVRDADITNMARIAGLLPLRSYGQTSIGSIYFTPSHVVDSRQRSERGLMDMVTEEFRFVRDYNDDYSDDIANEASPSLRMSLVPEGTTPIGYVPYGSNLYTVEGAVIWENILTEPPADGTPYVPFYGERFLTHEEVFTRDTPVPVALFKNLFDCLQQIRRNGPSVANFITATGILGEGAIYDLEIVPHDGYFTVYYSVGNDSQLINNHRLTAWREVCQLKFKLFTLEQRI